MRVAQIFESLVHRVFYYSFVYNFVNVFIQMELACVFSH